MTPARWRRITEIYSATAVLGPDERARFLDGACAGDEALRREVESLLAYKSVADDFLRTPSPVPADVSAPPSAKLTGTRLGSYEIRAPLGAGGMGEVYAAYDPRLERLVAIKVLRDEFGGDADRFSRFEREARATAALNHPNIISIYDIGTHEGAPYIVMEYVAGETLHAHLRRGRPPLRRALEIGREIAAGLVAAHARGILHRDLKPGNVMILPDGRVKVLDFGLAKLLSIDAAHSHDAAVNAPLRTRSGRLLGTPAYMSPEQLLGQPADYRSDIYSLGVILFELVTGRRTDPIPLASEIETSLPSEVSRLIARMLERDPSARPESAEQVRAQLERLARVPNRRTAMRIASTLLVAAAVIAIIVTIGRRSVPEPAVARTPAAVAPRASPLRLGVLPAQNPSRRPEFETWRLLIQSLITGELTGVQDLGVLDPLTLNGRMATALHAEAAESPAQLLSTVRESGATWMTSTQITPLETGAEIQLSLVDVGTGEVRFMTRAQASRESDLPLSVRTLASSVVKYFQLQVLRAAGDKDIAPWISLRDRNIDAVKAFAQANEYLFRFQLTEVEPHLRRAIELDPAFIAPRIWYISGLRGRGRRAEAAEQLAFVQRLAPTASPFEQAMIGYARALLADDSPGQAGYLRAALTYSPANNILLVNLATAYEGQSDCAAALAALTGPIQMKWHYPAMYKLWGSCAIAERRLDDARRVMVSSLDLPGVDPNVYALLEGLELAIGTREQAHVYARLFAETLRTLNRSADTRTLAAAYERLAAHAREHGASDRAGELSERARNVRSKGPPPAD